MDFHAFVFWNNGLYISRIINKPSSKKRRRIYLFNHYVSDTDFYP